MSCNCVNNNCKLGGLDFVWEAVCKEFEIPEMEQIEFNEFCKTNPVNFSDFNSLRDAAVAWNFKAESLSAEDKKKRSNVSLPKGLLLRYPTLSGVLFDKLVYVRDEQRNSVGVVVVVREGVGKVVGWSLCHKLAGDVWDAKKGIFQAVMRTYTGKDCEIRNVEYVLDALRKRLIPIADKYYRQRKVSYSDRYWNFTYLHAVVKQIKEQLNKEGKESEWKEKTRF